MPALAEYQERMTGEDKEDALAAATELSNFYFIYNEEYNALLTKQYEAELKLFDVTHAPTGVDQAEALRLQGLILSTGARMKYLDAKMMAFHSSAISITPPTQAVVKKVKALAAELAALVAKDTAIKKITAALTELASLINKSAP